MAANLLKLVQATVTKCQQEVSKAAALRSADKGEHCLTLRELSRMVNAEIREARGLVDSVRP